MTNNTASHELNFRRIGSQEFRSGHIQSVCSCGWTSDLYSTATVEGRRIAEDRHTEHLRTVDTASHEHVFDYWLGCWQIICDCGWRSGFENDVNRIGAAYMDHVTAQLERVP